MKTLLSLAFAIFISAFAVQAQDYASVEKEARAKTDKIAESLNLTEEQDVLFYRQNYELALNTARLKKMDASADEKKRMAKSYMTRYDRAVKEILDEGQYEKYLEVREKHESKDDARMRK